MTPALKMYAVEFDGGRSRAFNLTDFSLENGHLYQGIMLFTSLEAAKAEVDEENNSIKLEPFDEPFDEPEDEFFVTPVLVHPDGRIFDEFGELLNEHISMQTGRSMSDVVADARAMHSHQMLQARKALAQQLSPGL